MAGVPYIGGIFLAQLTVNEFKEQFKNMILRLYAEDVTDSDAHQQFTALAILLREQYAPNLKETRQHYENDRVKEAYYFAIEFLPGRMLQTTMLNLGLTDTITTGLMDMGLDVEKIIDAEPDPGLGNGGLGRLGSEFLDSAAALHMALNGNGIRYQYGLFRQMFDNGFQVEMPDDWLRNGNSWEVRRENRACLVRFGGNVWMAPDAFGRLVPHYENTTDVLAVPYDTGIVGYLNHTVNTFRLWSAELPTDPSKTYNLQQKEDVNEITEILYPDDSNYAGRLLRLKQEYFLVSAGVQSIVRHYRKHHRNLNHMDATVAIHINDTHPAMAIPELMRILMDEEFMSWDQAWALTTKVMSYTNHTLLAESLETWPMDMVAQTVPRIYQIIQEIDRRFRGLQIPVYGEERVNRCAPLGDGVVRMAYLAVIGSHSVNGVAKLHTELLESSVLKDLYRIFPEKFNNKTNGVTMRRWIQIANPPLTKLLDTEVNGDWKHRPLDIIGVQSFAKDPTFLKKLQEVKAKNKRSLAKKIREKLDISVDPDHAIFDVQIKRLHAYKRQLLHALYIIDEYQQIKAGQKLAVPRVHIFGAKAAPSYYYAKEIIKMINELAKVINHDPDVGDQLRVIFVPNYGVSEAEEIIPAADVSEQISLAGKEASGTSNMKLMANGAITLATMDGANIEIADAVGQDNIVIFGMTATEVAAYTNYSSQAIYDGDKHLQKVVNALVDGTIPNIDREGRDIYNSLLQYNDEYYVLADYESYAKAQDKITTLYQDPQAWYQMAAINIAKSGQFSSDLTIARYGDDIWHLTRDQFVN